MFVLWFLSHLPVNWTLTCRCLLYIFLLTRIDLLTWPFCKYSIFVLYISLVHASFITLKYLFAKKMTLQLQIYIDFTIITIRQVLMFLVCWRHSRETIFSCLLENFVCKLAVEEKEPLTVLRKEIYFLQSRRMVIFHKCLFIYFSFFEFYVSSESLYLHEIEHSGFIWHMESPWIYFHLQGRGREWWWHPRTKVHRPTDILSCWTVWYRLKLRIGAEWLFHEILLLPFYFLIVLL